MSSTILNQHAPAVTPAVLAGLISKPTASVMLVDPDLAARWLARNEANRNLRAAQVA